MTKGRATIIDGESKRTEFFDVEERLTDQIPPSEPAPTPEQRLDAVEAETKSVRSDVDVLSIIITGKEVSHDQ